MAAAVSTAGRMRTAMAWKAGIMCSRQRKSGRFWGRTGEMPFAVNTGLPGKGILKEGIYRTCWKMRILRLPEEKRPLGREWMFRHAAGSYMITASAGRVSTRMIRSWSHGTDG